jgi:biotin operon repressor
MSSMIQKEIKKLSDLIKKQNEKIEILTRTLTKIESYGRAKTEQFSEQTEQLLAPKSLEMIKGRHREILALLMNEGFHTYEQLADKLDISQSRARAYITELKSFGVPLRQVKDPEGYKVGIETSFVEKVLAFK